MFRMYAGIAVALFIGLAVWAGYSYYTNTQEALQTLSAENARLEVALLQERENIRKIREFQRQQALITEALNKSFADAEEPLREVERIFSDNNFEQLVIDNPTLMEQSINTATDNIFKKIECETGGRCE